MFTAIGFVVVLGAVVGGFVLEGGPIAILNQTTEFLIIGGAAIGSLLAGTPTKVMSAMVTSLKGAVNGAGYSKADYMELFAMLYEVFSVMRKSGEMGVVFEQLGADGEPAIVIRINRQQLSFAALPAL